MSESKQAFGDPNKVHSIFSSFIAGTGYQNGVLRVVFKSGKALDYFNVPKEVRNEFMRDFGKAWHKHLKGNYSEAEVTDWVYDKT